MSAASTQAPIRFDGRVVIVTGAGRGIGRAVALRLAERGARLVLNNRRAHATGADAASALAAQIRADGGTAVPETSDVSRPEAASALVTLALATYGRLDAVVHNAGVIESCPVDELAERDLMRLFAINTLSAFRLTQAALPSLRRQGSGRIVFTTSTAGLYGGEGLAAYSMSKGALLGLMRAVAAEEARSGILANAICPTAVTRMTEAFVPDDAHRAALAPERVAPAVAWLASEACSFSGRVVMAGGGRFRSAHTLQSRGIDLHPQREIRPEDLAARADEILAPADLRGFADAGAHFAALLDEVGRDVGCEVG